MTAERSITIVGAGLTGALMAKYLGMRGHRVSVYDKRPDIRDAELIRGRSINLAVSTRGLTSLQQVGLQEQVLEMAVPMRGRMMHSVEGDLSFQPYSKNPKECIQSVSRGELNRLLVESAAEHENVSLHFDHQCVDVDPDSGRAFFLGPGSPDVVEAGADLVIGADGAFSAVRGRLQRTDRFQFQQQYLEHGYLELNIPPEEGGGFRLEKNALHIWPRRSFMMIALPNLDGSFTVTCFWPLEGENSFGRLATEEQVLEHFRRWFADAVPHMPTLAEDYLRAPPSTLATIRCYPWARGKVALIGDAAHAVVPFYGQGMNAGFEDCRVLHRELGESPDDWAVAIDRYQRDRKPHGDAIADLAIGNFLEMRDHVASPLFRLRKRGEKLLHRLFPGLYVPLYSLVTFSNTPYADAVARARRQGRAVIGGVSVIGLVLLILIVSWLWN